MKILVEHLDRMEAVRPGYKKRLTSVGVVKKGVLEISAQDYTAASLAHVEKTAESIYFHPENRGPGEIMAYIIRQITGERMCPRCRTRVNWMNEAGWKECWKQRKMIVGWIVEEAKERGYDVKDKAASALLKAAFTEYRKTRKEMKKNGQDS